MKNTEIGNKTANIN